MCRWSDGRRLCARPRGIGKMKGRTMLEAKTYADLRSAAVAGDRAALVAVQEYHRRRVREGRRQEALRSWAQRWRATCERVSC